MNSFTRVVIIASLGFIISKLCYDLGLERGKVAALTTFVDDEGTYYVSKEFHNGNETKLRNKTRN